VAHCHDFAILWLNGFANNGLVRKCVCQPFLMSHPHAGFPERLFYRSKIFSFTDGTETGLPRLGLVRARLAPGIRATAPARFRRAKGMSMLLCTISFYLSI
tara:strand:- start:975 stop:1277 length:303 start_codon:yes stop_codon:yes gene_type:complete